MIALLVLLALLLGLSHWLLEPLVQLGTTLLELTWLPWLVLLLGAWLLAGQSGRPHS